MSWFERGERKRRNEGMGRKMELIWRRKNEKNEKKKNRSKGGNRERCRRRSKSAICRLHARSPAAAAAAPSTVAQRAFVVTGAGSSSCSTSIRGKWEKGATTGAPTCARRSLVLTLVTVIKAAPAPRGSPRTLSPIATIPTGKREF